MKSVDLPLCVLACNINVRCGDQASFDLLAAGYSAFVLPIDPDFQPALSIDVSVNDKGTGWSMSCENTAITCIDRYDLIYEFEKFITERVQLMRANLFFVHGAALSIADRCVVISGKSGCGKSSLAWFMTHNGFEYLSDELSPVNPDFLLVEPYPHALCMKNEPLTEPVLPESTLFTEGTIHVPAFELPARAVEQACPLSFLVFIDKGRHGQDLAWGRIGGAESAARLYSNGLNHLSHHGDGLPVVASIGSRVPSYLMSGGTVEERAQVVKSLFN